ncbi:unnamed protein product [Caenorhabditis bovis]|uniref:DUF281 domain-containing protein n=1 Tax=Caenorhabditis bovis TaxID=2654633 RepID=A0A8S1EUM1_9PELO|nr:unnamed protein product [Caenorhabditis bovis]
MILTISIFAGLISTISAQGSCVQCATPYLKNNWAITSLPKIPANLIWSDNCLAASGDDLNEKQATCTNNCFEMLLPLDGNYEVVRGCFADFVGTDVTEVEGEHCEANVVTNYGAVKYRTQTFTAAFTAIRYCKAKSDGTCNNELVSTKVHNDKIDNCTPGTTVTCKSCGEYDGVGDCSASTKSTCQGVYCTKTAGKLNGHWYESRGCAGINPFGKDICQWNDQVFNISTEINSPDIPSRSKRSIALGFSANKCICKGELCNSTSATSIAAAILIALIASIF